MIVAIVAVAFCVLGAVILFFYREKKVMSIIAKDEDKAYLDAIKDEKDFGEAESETPVVEENKEQEKEETNEEVKDPQE